MANLEKTQELFLAVQTVIHGTIDYDRGWLLQKIPEITTSKFSNLIAWLDSIKRVYPEQYK